MIHYYASKFARGILQVCGPVGLLWLALIVITVLLWRKGERRFALATGMLVLFIQSIGGSELPTVLLRELERPYGEVKIETLPVCDAIVVLGGGFEPSPLEVANLHLTPAADRIVMGLELTRLGKAPALCIGGSGVYIGGEHFVESEVVGNAITERRMTKAEVLPLGRCANTAEEAQEVRKLHDARNWRRVLLVTSANHMRRAEATFRTAGVEVVAAPCNFMAFDGGEESWLPLRVPGAGGFVRFSTWLHEWVGWLSYRVRGRIGGEDSGRRAADSPPLLEGVGGR